MTHELPEMILNVRKHAGLTQKELADLAGVAKNLVYELEKGKKSVRYSNLLKVLHVLNIEVKYILPPGVSNA